MALCRSLFMCFLLLAVSLTEVLSQDQCRLGWVYRNGYCFGLAREWLSWSEAENICRAYGGSLAEIHSQEDNDFIKSLLVNASVPAEVKGVWIGGTDMFYEGSWEWIGSKILMAEFTDWGPNEPNNIIQGGREDCLSMWKDMNWAWNDEYCTKSSNNVLYFLCQTRSGLYEDIIG